MVKSKVNTIQELETYALERGARLIKVIFNGVELGPDVKIYSRSQVYVECMGCEQQYDIQFNRFCKRATGKCNSCAKIIDDEARAKSKTTPKLNKIGAIKGTLKNLGYQTDVLFEYDNKSQTIKTLCQCGGEVSSKYDTIIKRKKAKCNKCRNTIPTELIRKYAGIVGSRIVCDSEFVKIRESIKYVCDCGKTKSKSAENLLKFPLCAPCIRRTNFRPILEQQDFPKSNHNGQKFFNLLEEKGWAMLSPVWHYLNDNSALLVACPMGHLATPFFENFNNEHGCTKCARKNDAEEIRIRMLDKGLQLLSYDTYATQAQFRCLECDNECYIVPRSVDSRSGRGCTDCLRLYSLNQVKKFLKDRGMRFLGPDDVSHFNRNDIIKCLCSCEELYETTWRMIQKGANCDKCKIPKTTQTNLERYGMNPACLDETKAKVVATCEETYGCHPSKLFENRKKATETDIANHGGVHSASLPENVQKRSGAFVAKYHDTYGNVKEIRDKMKKTNQEKLGVDYPLQNKNVRKKAMDNAYTRYEYKLPSGRLVAIQGYENHAIRYLLPDFDESSMLIGNDPGIPEISYFYDQGQHTYHPDIFVPELNCIIEVKSPHTWDTYEEQNYAKMKGVIRAGFRAWVLVFIQNGTLVDSFEFDENSFDTLEFEE